MRRHLVITAILWLLLTVVTEVIILNVELLPLAAAREARISDEAFDLLMLLGAPVFSFVIAVLVYSLLNFRSKGDPQEDGPPLKPRGAVGPIWLAITSALAIYVIFNPGLVGLAELREDRQAEMVVRVTGSQWLWRLEYPDHGVTSNSELVLPVNKRVKFEVTATDVVHSFWIPAFRMKIDAVPGLVTTTYVTPEKTGTTQDEPSLRLQCAEMCGLAHFAMKTNVRVVEQAEFDDWVAAQQAKQQTKK